MSWPRLSGGGGVWSGGGGCGGGSRLYGTWRRREGRGAGERRACEASVGLSRLHLQQSQHGRVVPELHPALGGQAHVLGQVVHGSWTREGGERSGQTGGPDRRHMSHLLSFHPPPTSPIRAENRLWQEEKQLKEAESKRSKKKTLCHPLSEVGTLLARSMCILLKSPCCHSHGSPCVFYVPVFITLGISDFMPSTLHMADHFPPQTAALSPLRHSLTSHCAQSPS